MPRSTPPKAGEDRLIKDLLAIAFLTLGAFLLAALIFNAHGYGFLTHALARAFTLALGLGAFGVPAVAFALAAFYGLEKPPVTPVRALVGVALMFMAVLTMIHLQTPKDVVSHPTPPSQGTHASPPAPSTKAGEGILQRLALGAS
ncbi:MAG: hypothetical protein WCP21_07155, partial [Armatimonadota bacterium]